jgi:hypothetical protein
MKKCRFDVKSWCVVMCLISWVLRSISTGFFTWCVVKNYMYEYHW